METNLIAVLSDNKRVLYSVHTNTGNAIFEAEIKDFAGNKYYQHKGINHLLPKQFNGKKPVLR